MKKPITVAELLEKLNRDPDFIKAQAQRDAEHAKKVSEMKIAERGLIEELGNVGVHVESVWDLVNTAEKYTIALPILLKHLQLEYPADVRDGIARSLAVPESKFAWNSLTEMYKSEGDEQVKDGISCAISVIADLDLVDALIELVANRENGGSRIFMLRALDRMGRHDVLSQLESDPGLSQAILQIYKQKRNSAKRRKKHDGAIGRK